MTYKISDLQIQLVEGYIKGHQNDQWLAWRLHFMCLPPRGNLTESRCRGSY